VENLNADVFARSFGQVGSTVLVVAVAVVALEVILYFALKRGLKWKYALPVMLVAPAFIGLAILVLYPIIYNFRLAFSNMSLRRFTPERGMTTGFVEAWQNIRTVFTEPVLKQQHFFPVFLRTILWTFMQVTVHVVFGMMLALLLNRPMKLRGFYRTLLLFPWAIPQLIAVLAWRGEFNYQYGYINTILRGLGLNPVNWLTDPVANFMAFNIVNFWLGIPFMTVILLGGLQSIDHTYYEAAEIDGASKARQFRTVTLPLMQPVMTPAIILGVIWTFNLFVVPFMINQNELETSDILVTALFRAAFEYNRYGFAAMFALIIFLLLLGFSVAYMKITGFNPRESITGRIAAAVGE
jgi:arabinogalactan oligomer/maltooligosaccharide transport system permease protein